MKAGTLISRHCVVTLHNSMVVVDWGNGTCQDVQTGKFFECEEKDVSHTTLDEELEVLRKNGLVEAFDAVQVHFTTLPDFFKNTLD